MIRCIGANHWPPNGAAILSSIACYLPCCRGDHSWSRVLCLWRVVELVDFEGKKRRPKEKKIGEYKKEIHLDALPHFN